VEFKTQSLIFKIDYLLVIVLIVTIFMDTITASLNTFRIILF